MQAVFPCQVQPFPCTYLGAPLSLTWLARADEQGLVDKVAARIPTWKAGLLNAAGRTTLTQTTLSAIPVHVSITCCLSPWAIAEIDKRRRGFLWTSKLSAHGGSCKLAWPVVCAPRDIGGLGIPDLRLLGLALRLHWEWLRRTAPDSACASLPSRAEKHVQAMFQASVIIELGDGSRALFWTDSWLPGGPISAFAPALFGAVPPRRRKRCVRNALTDMAWVDEVTGAPTAPVLCDFVDLWELLEGIELQPGVPDRFVWRWTPDGTYSASSAYRAFFVGRTQLEGATHLWHADVPPKVRFFFWVALHGRLWTAERRAHHGLQASATCVLCDQEVESDGTRRCPGACAGLWWSGGDSGHRGEREIDEKRNNKNDMCC